MMSKSTQSHRLILYVDIDAFFPSVEQVRFPALRGKPLIVGSGVVASSSYEARSQGIRPGTSIADAMRLHPRVVVLKGHQRTYRAFAECVFEHCRRLSPNVDTYLDEAFCDLTGMPAYRKPPLEIATVLKKQILDSTGLKVTIGIGSNRMIAKLAGKDAKPDGIGIVKHGEEEAFMAHRPISDVPGIGPKAQELLKSLGVTHVKHLKHFPLAYLETVFASDAALIYERLRGRDPQTPASVPKWISRETSLHQDTIDLEKIADMLYYLTERACREARRIRVIPRRIAVRVRYRNGCCASSSQRIHMESVLDRMIFEVGFNLLHKLCHRCRIHLVGISFTDLMRCEDSQTRLYDDPVAERLEHLYRAVDDIRNRFGHSAVIAGKSIALINQLERDSYAYVLRTPSLTK